LPEGRGGFGRPSAKVRAGCGKSRRLREAGALADAARLPGSPTARRREAVTATHRLSTLLAATVCDGPAPLLDRAELTDLLASDDARPANPFCSSETRTPRGQRRAFARSLSCIDDLQWLTCANDGRALAACSANGSRAARLSVTISPPRRALAPHAMDSRDRILQKRGCLRLSRVATAAVTTT
jgi:hypothetical protein